MAASTAAATAIKKYKSCWQWYLYCVLRAFHLDFMPIAKVCRESWQLAKG